MKKLLVFLMILALVLPLCSFTSNNPKYRINYSMDISSKIIVCIGDSLTQRDFYQQKLRNLLGADWEVINKGVSGEYTLDMVHRFTSDVLAYNPFAVIIWAGTNDISWNYTSVQIVNNLHSMYKKASEAGIKVVALNISPRGGFPVPAEPTLTEVNDWINTAPYIDYFVDDYSLLVDPANPGHLLPAFNDGDGLHINSDGGSAVGQMIYNILFVDPAPIPHPPGLPPLVFGGLTGNDVGLVFYDKEIQSSNREVTLSVLSGATALTTTGHALHEVRIDETSENVSDIITKVYDIKPQGATFLPFATLSFIYTGGDYEVISWNGTGWFSQNTTLDLKKKTASCQITHSSKYAFIKKRPVIEDTQLLWDQNYWIESLKYSLCLLYK